MKKCSLWYEDRYLTDPVGVAVDQEGYVYIWGVNSKNVHQVSPDGEKIKVLLDSRQVPQGPRAVCIDRPGHTLNVVTQYGESGNCDTVCVFRLV
jgi:sugar lactone lactonase YvrE